MKFSESMRKQYLNRTELFKAKFGKDDILPEMDIRFIKAVQSIGGEGALGFSNWFEAYNYMLDEIHESDFDVAILGCGAYGFPLASEIVSSFVISFSSFISSSSKNSKTRSLAAAAL